MTQMITAVALLATFRDTSPMNASVEGVPLDNCVLDTTL